MKLLVEIGVYPTTGNKLQYEPHFSLVPESMRMSESHIPIGSDPTNVSISEEIDALRRIANSLKLYILNYTESEIPVPCKHPAGQNEEQQII